MFTSENEGERSLAAAGYGGGASILFVLLSLWLDGASIGLVSLTGGCGIVVCLLVAITLPVVVAVQHAVVQLLITKYQQAQQQHEKGKRKTTEMITTAIMSL